MIITVTAGELAKEDDAAETLLSAADSDKQDDLVREQGVDS
jgi:hypothetical protein